MTLRFKGPSGRMLANALASASREARAHAKAVMMAEANLIKDIAEDQTPVQTGELELAFTLEEKRLRADRTAFHINVGGIVKGVNVDEYALTIHEGPSHATPANLAKSARTGRFVGNQFLARAYDEQIANLIARTTDALMNGVKVHVG